MSPKAAHNSGQAQNHTNDTRIGETEDEWDHKSVTKRYHRMRVTEALEHVKKLQENSSKEEFRVKLEKLEEDERRIMKCRARLSNNPSTKKLQTELKDSFEKWWNEVKSVKEEKKEIWNPWNERKVKPTICSELGNMAMEVGDEDDAAHDIKAYFMFFEMEGQHWRGKTVLDQGFPEHEEFPNQRIPIHTALHDNTHNPFRPSQDKSGKPSLKYIHIPANHMGWIEQVVARYHDEHEKKVEQRVKTNKTLSREFWKGQLHGGGLGRNPIHATHMRSRCSIIPGETQSMFGEQKQSSTDHGSKEDVKRKKYPYKDLAIFMPYLHWETSARRARMAKAIQAMLDERQPKNEKPRNRTKRAETLRQDIEKKYKNRFQTPEQRNVEIARKMMEKTAKRSKLGQYLLKLAQVWDAMDMELDERLVKQSLKGSEPSLHVRRTLDQSYFLNLKDTSQRDQDQVVYRATQGHGSLTRIVMVDQLWLWVLDGHTVITSFPKRWGRNKPDSSGIHKSLRERLRQPESKIMSAWHLASVIIDQCSSVFFDRTAPLDLRPEVMDIFAETLGDVNHYTTIAFKTFWHSVEAFSPNRDSRGSSRRSQKYLDINPEGTLLREAQDIAEELRIMNGIFSQQLGVVKSFQKCLDHMNGGSKTRTKQQSAGWTQELTNWPVLIAELDFLEDLVEEVDNRKAEIADLGSAALQTCQQLQELLSLKQQQASIVEAKAAIDRADQSVEQGKAIMAFTIMTIIFTPLGFFTSFFGMNHSLTGDDWMTLAHQCIYMFCLSSVIIAMALSLAFKGSQIRHFLKSLRDPKARWQDFARWKGKAVKSGKKAIKKIERDWQSEADGMNGASTGEMIEGSHFRARRLPKSATLGTLLRRNNQGRNDVESSGPEQHEIVRSKTTD